MSKLHESERCNVQSPNNPKHRCSRHKHHPGMAHARLAHHDLNHYALAYWPDNPTEALAAPLSDPVNHPSHYTRFGSVEVIDIVEHLNFCRGNAIKYIARAGAKDASKELEDLEKAQWYLTREIARLKKASNK